ncbi:MAG: histidinol-phosphatase HisJ family protein [Clostridiales bacterium]|nr:histidinol-phosphatase HisJ family protein [Clostridiales bacterium]
MIANYHTHTWRCNHAQGTEREYIEAAIAMGLRELGFADHSPYPFSNGHVSGFRMRPDQLDDYCTTLTALRDEYAHDIAIHIGLEAEYYPDEFGRLLDLIDGYPIEYLIQGQHFTFNEYDGLYAGAETRDEAVLEQYCRQVVEGQATGRYLYIAHPDLIHFVGRPKVYEKHMRAMLRALKDMNALIEFNMLGFIENRNYPMPAFWRMAGEEGLRAVIGLDAHRPGHFGNADALKAAQEILEHNGIPLVERLQIH